MIIRSLTFARHIKGMKSASLQHLVLASFICILALNGCAPRDAAIAQTEATMLKAKTAREAIMPKLEAASPLTEEDAPWFGDTSISAQAGEALPEALENGESIVITFERPLTLEQLAMRLQAVTNMRVTVETGGAAMDAVMAADGMPPQMAGRQQEGKTFVPADGQEVTGGRIVWQGKLSNLLDQVADRFDAEWQYSHNSIRISQQIVRTYMLHALAGSTDVGGSVKTGSGGGDTGLPQQSVDSTSKLALWDEIQKTIDTIIAGRARASYSPATGTITLAGYPSAVKAAEEYLQLQNKLRLRRVAIEAQVLSVLLNKQYENNVDLDVVVREAFNNQPFVFSSGQPSGTDPGRTVTTGLLRQIPAGLGTDGSVQLVINALSAVANRVTVEYTGSLVTLSDQPAPLQVATKRSYVARVTGTQGQTTSSTTLEPGTIDIGLSMNILPRVIEADRIMLRIALGITDLVQLREFTSGESSIQLPEVDSTGFLQNAVLQSGETLVLAGFERKGANDTEQGTGHESNWLLGGGKSYGQRREVRVLLIKATLLPEEPVSVLQP
jgi:type IVB pilus formation R64 PilN family outer membrane protein